MEVKKTVTTERVVGVICDACEDDIPLDVGRGKIYYDPEDYEWEEKDLCRRCYYLAIDFINVDIPKRLREDND